MKRVLAFSSLLVLILASQAFPCFSPTDKFAVEVIINKPGANYDLRAMESAVNVSFEKDAYVYRSHFNRDVAVILREIDESQISELLRGLSVRIQIPTESVIVDGVEDLVEAVDLAKDKFDFGSAMRMELDWLRANKLIAGIDEEDIAEIATVAEAGLAGWNSRIVYEDGKWLPYHKTSDPALIRKVDCGGFDLERLPYDETAILPEPSVITSHRRLTARWGAIKAGM